MSNITFDQVSSEFVEKGWTDITEALVPEVYRQQGDYLVLHREYETIGAQPQPGGQFHTVHGQRGKNVGEFIGDAEATAAFFRERL